MMPTPGDRIEEELEIALSLAAESVETAQRSSDLVTVMADGRSVMRSRLRLSGGSDKERLDHQSEVFRVVGRALGAADALIVVLDGRARPAPAKTWPGQAVQSPGVRQCLLAAALSRAEGTGSVAVDTKFVVWSYRLGEGGWVEWDAQLVTRWGAQVLRKRRTFSPAFEAITEGLERPGVSPAAAERMLVELGQRPFGTWESIAN